MSISNISGPFSAYQYVNQMRKTAAGQEKWAGRKRNMELSQEAAEKRRALTEMQNKKEVLAKILQSRMFDAGTNFYIINQPQTLNPAVMP